MKRMLRKMTACFMALAMILALSVGAFAAADATVGYGSNTVLTSGVTATFSSSDSDLDGVVITLTNGSAGTYTPSSSNAAYTVELDDPATPSTITIKKGAEVAGTITASGVDASSHAENEVVTFTLSVPESASGSASGTTSWTSTASDGSGSGTGVGKLEGVNPDSVVNVILPTVGSDTYDMYLDPHDLLNDTNWARYGGADSLEWSGSDGRLFFNAGSNSDGKVTFGNDSIALDVINRSQINVKVKLDLTVTKSDGAEALVFTDSSGELAKTTGAYLYLGVVAVASTGAEATADTTPANAGTEYTTFVEADGDDGSASCDYTLPGVDVFERSWDATNGKYIYQIDSSGRPDTDFNKLTFNLTGKINPSNAWDNMGKEPVAVELTWTVTDADAVENKAPSAKVTSKAAAQSANGAETFAVISYDLGSGDSAATEVTGFKFGTTEWDMTNGNLTLDADAKTLTVKAIYAAWNATSWYVVFDTGDEVAVTIK